MSCPACSSTVEVDGCQYQAGACRRRARAPPLEATKPAFEKVVNKPKHTFENAVSQQSAEPESDRSQHRTDEPKAAPQITMASPHATDEVAGAVFQSASKLQEAVEAVRGLLEDETDAVGPAEESLREYLVLVVESARASLAAAHGISNLAESMLAAAGEQAAAEVASSRKNESMRLTKRLQQTDAPAPQAVPILITKETVRNSVKQHWYDEESPGMVLELRVRVEPPFNRLWRSVATYLNTIRDAINEECDLVECDVDTEVDQDTEHTPSRPDTQPRRAGLPDPALPRTPFNPTTTPLSTTSTIPESTTSHERYPQMHGALPPSPPTPMQRFMHPGQYRQDSTGGGFLYRDASLPVLATPQAGATSTAQWPPSFAAETPSPSAQNHSPLQPHANPSLSSLAESPSLTQHQHDGTHTSARPYGMLDTRPALFPPSRPSQSPGGQHTKHRDQAAMPEQASAPKSKESRYQELRQGIIGKRNNSSRW